jgi:hypothetical protein
MAERKVVTPTTTRATNTTTIKDIKNVDRKKQPASVPLFHKDNFMWMGIGAVVIAIGMFMMAGGKNENPNEFDYKTVYSTTRITIAPILILAGLMVEIYAIFKKPKLQQ